MAKDLFSEQASRYAKYRPTYPEELFQYVLRFVEKRECAWDCATGNGQAAAVLAQHFIKVEATDISERQLENATPKNNIHYRIAPAEHTPFADDSVDLITIATAYHWLNWKAFQKEATRVGKNGCVVAAWAYHVFYSIDPSITSIIRHFYHHIIGSYWDEERQYVDERYATVDFPFSPLPAKEFKSIQHWTREDFLGYLSTWSAVQHYVKQHRSSPFHAIANLLKKHWPVSEPKEFHFPLFVRLGRIIK